MKAMILAAGRGERMRPLTDQCPKPLLEVCGKPLIIHHIERLRKAGFGHFVINLHHLGEQIRARLGDGRSWGVEIQYSEEAPQALETAGGIIKALPMLGAEPFFVINADIWTDQLPIKPELPASVQAHLLLTRNPDHNPGGDFGLNADGLVQNSGEEKWTFTGMAWYRPEFFAGLKAVRQPLAPLLRKAADQQQVTGSCLAGSWMDIGTPERLAEINAQQDRNLCGKA